MQNSKDSLKVYLIPPSRCKGSVEGFTNPGLWSLMSFLRLELPDFFIKGMAPSINDDGGLEISIYQVRLFMGYKARIPKIVEEFNRFNGTSLKVIYSNGRWIFNI